MSLQNFYIVEKGIEKFSVNKKMTESWNLQEIPQIYYAVQHNSIYFWFVWELFSSLLIKKV